MHICSSMFLQSFVFFVELSTDVYKKVHFHGPVASSFSLCLIAIVTDISRRLVSTESGKKKKQNKSVNLYRCASHFEKRKSSC